MREIVLDTETTGLDPAKGDRLVEIGAVELVNSVRTDKHYHVYINPERDMPEGAFAVHGLSAAFLSGYPVFAERVEGFLNFVRGAKLVIHNAEFDMRFINAELATLGHPPIGNEWVIDTLAMARAKHPGSPASLDALCARYRIDNSKRVKHGALVDAEILAEVYVELQGGRQTSLGLQSVAAARLAVQVGATRRRPQPLPPARTEAEYAAHLAFVASLGEKSIWAGYANPVAEQVDRQLAALGQ